QQQTTTNVVTLHPSATILLSGPLAGSNSSQQQQQQQQSQSNFGISLQCTHSEQSSRQHGSHCLHLF
ncbi:unnamed protein product, partial [Rotaria sp. Silwood2]